MADGGGVADLTRLMGEMRPRLHRYCARMVGSAIDGEDVVQDALAKAAGADPAGIDHPERWLFRIARNAALDALRRRRRQSARHAGADLDALSDPAMAADSRVVAAAGLAAFLQLPPAQRAIVILADVLGHSLAESTQILDITLPAAKAALHRGRARLKAVAETPADPPPPSPADRERLHAYADQFNARDFDALRALLAEDVRLDLANRLRLTGRKDVALYFTRYEENRSYRASVCLADGRPALRFTDPANGADYVVLLEWRDGFIAGIRDFRYAPYVAEGLCLSPLLISAQAEQPPQ
ncbi:MAG TPA: sigma-70 family RNA polymerase sigma factor [Caulobacteraceae bacterium]